MVRFAFPMAAVVSLGMAMSAAYAGGAPAGSQQFAGSACAPCAKPGYWSATNYDGASAGSKLTPRVVVSGYHPLAGFEAESAAERAALHHGTIAVAAGKDRAAGDTAN